MVPPPSVPPAPKVAAERCPSDFRVSKRQCGTNRHSRMLHSRKRVAGTQQSQLAASQFDSQTATHFLREHLTWHSKLDSTAHVVWWALPLGGLIGAIAKIITTGGDFYLPCWGVAETTGRRLWTAGFLGDVALRMIAALVMGGLSASTFAFQGEYDSVGSDSR